MATISSTPRRRRMLCGLQMPLSALSIHLSWLWLSGAVFPTSFKGILVRLVISWIDLPQQLSLWVCIGFLCSSRNIWWYSSYCMKEDRQGLSGLLEADGGGGFLLFLGLWGDGSSWGGGLNELVREERSFRISRPFVQLIWAGHQKNVSSQESIGISKISLQIRQSNYLQKKKKIVFNALWDFKYVGLTMLDFFLSI